MPMNNCGFSQGNPQPYTLYGGPAVAFAIQCAGGGTYVVSVFLWSFPCRLDILYLL